MRAGAAQHVENPAGIRGRAWVRIRTRIRANAAACIGIQTGLSHDHFPHCLSMSIAAVGGTRAQLELAAFGR
jgi:hypothetical protein